METLLTGDALDVGIAFEEVRSPDIEGQTLLSEASRMVGNSHPYATRRPSRSARPAA